MKYFMKIGLLAFVVFIAAFVCVPHAEAAIAYVDGASCGAASGCTTAMVNASGANFAVCGVTYYYAFSPGMGFVADSNMNSYTPGTPITLTSTITVVPYYSENATMTNGMTFSLSGSSSFSAFSCMAFSGVKTSMSFDKESAGATNASSATIQPGSSTPTNDNALLFTFFGDDAVDISGVPTINGGFSSMTQGVNYEPYFTGFGNAASYLIQTSKTAANPTWTRGSARGVAAGMIIFDAATGGGCTPDHLTITTQPMSSTFAVGVGTVVEVKDSGGTTCTSDTSNITVSSHSGSPCSTLTSATNLTKAATAGVATWAPADLTTALNGTGCTIDAADGMLTGATSSAFTICQQGSGVDYCGVHGHAASANTNTATVTVTTTGSTALVGYCAYGNTGGMVGNATFSDGDSQTWTALTPYQGTALDDEILGFYIENPTVGSSKTYTCTTTAQFPAICLIGITGTTTSIFRAENGSGTSGAAMTLSPGNVTVTATDIVLSALSVNAIAGTVTIGSSFKISDHQAYVAATNYGLDCGFKTGDSGTVGPAWSWGNSVNASGTNDVFKVGTVTASTSRLSLIGVGR